MGAPQTGPIGGRSPAAVGRYALGVAVLVVAITSQYFVPQAVPAVRGIYGSLAGDLAIVYAVPCAVFAGVVGTAPLRGWKANPKRASIAGLGWYGAMGVLGFFVTLALTAVYAAFDPSALKLLERPNPALEAARGDPWFYVGLSFAVGAVEETLFRGWVFGFWVRRVGSWVVPAVLSSLLFAALHVYYGTTYGVAAPLIFPTLFVLGFGFAATYATTQGNLVVPAALHGLFDASAYLTLISAPAGVAVRWLPIVAGALLALILYLGRSGTSTLPSPVLNPWAGLPPPTGSSAEPAGSAPMPPSDDDLRRALTAARTIAVVGLSEKPERDSNEVARYLRASGYRVVPVNPAVPEVLGERSYPSLAAIPPEIRVDLAVVFRRSDAVPPIVDEAIARGIPAVWMQLGVENPAAAETARRHGLFVVENTCSMATHRRLGIPPRSSGP